MTNEERDLLLRDLCGRLHTFLYVNIKGNIQVLNSWADDDGNFFNFLDDGPDGNYGEGFTLDVIKPYLRPMSSMTVEEREEFENLLEGIVDGVERWDKPDLCEEYDWLNTHHFDYRGLIPKGLALEALEGMYKTE